MKEEMVRIKSKKRLEYCSKACIGRDYCGGCIEDGSRCLSDPYWKISKSLWEKYISKQVEEQWELIEEVE